jgi:hypothetical protein
MLTKIHKREIPSTKYCALCDVPRRRNLTACPDCGGPLLPDLPVGIRWCGPVLLGVVVWLVETVLQDLVSSPFGASSTYQTILALPIMAAVLAVAYGAYFRRRYFVLVALLLCLGVGAFSAFYISIPAVSWAGILLASGSAFYVIRHRRHFVQADALESWPLVSLKLNAPSDDGPKSKG